MNLVSKNTYFNQMLIKYFCQAYDDDHLTFNITKLFKSHVVYNVKATKYYSTLLRLIKYYNNL